MRLAAISAVLILLFLGGPVQDAVSQTVPEQTQRKLAQTGFKFLSVSLDARSAAMADAATAIEGFSSSMFYNPANMARIEGFGNLSAGQTQWIADITYNLGSVAIRPADGRFGVIGFSVLHVDYGEIQETIRADNEQGFLDIGTYRPMALAIGVGYARAITDRFSVGGNVRYVMQNLGSHVMATDMTREQQEVSTPAFDFGVMYRTGFRSLNFAMSVRNFSPEITYQTESFQIPLSFNIGVSMDMLDFTEVDQNLHAVVLAIDAHRPRDYYEQLRFGVEYSFMNMFALRGGYLFPSDEQSFTAGAGIMQTLGGIGLGVDYAYSQFGIFNNVHRLSMQVSF